ncbi:pectin lyase-like superfamily protein [Actinidia rufa]|uniref:Pectin lyase-like superfamily protein n=1 Tax=Actinidia rufa TaxID=165716 RepID=A0A7J0HF64_9ERIC|nr:pectin lyase-like superfamily protein [Actinidia rufa]
MEGTEKTALLLLLPLSNAVELNLKGCEKQCDYKPKLQPRPHSVSILEFGAVGDGKTLNTIAFQNAIFYLKSFADKGGAQLYVPPGKWLTGSFNLTSHLTLFLARGAIILGSQDMSHWEVVEPLPSYGRGLELPGGRYRSLINGYMLNDVVITAMCKFRTFSVYAPPESPYTVGIVPDSSDSVCIENCSISTGYDAIALKSGWDEYGIAYDRPTESVHIKQVYLQSSSGSALAFGSEMSGGISDVLVEHLYIYNSFCGVEFRTTKGRGGYIKGIVISDTEMTSVRTAFAATGQSGSHPDDNFDPNALPILQQITLENAIGTNITLAGNFTGIQESPFTPICLSNISLSVTCSSCSSSSSWVCSNVLGSSWLVFPEPCPEFSNSSLSCSSLLDSDGRAVGL